MVKSVVPFIENAPVIAIHQGVSVDPARALFSSEDAQMGPYKNYAYLLRPLNLIVLPKRPPVSYRRVVVDLIEVDYSFVTDLIKVENNEAFFPGHGGYEVEPIITEDVINLSSNAVKLCDVGIKDKEVHVVPLEMFFSVVAPQLATLTEASLDALKAKKANVPITTNEQSPIDVRLESYLKGGYLTQRVLMLIGHSAVAKSARVKTIADKLGFRMIDLRTAFMSRLDLQGLTEIVYNPDGSVNSTQAPMQDIITCTDEYIKFCRAAIPEIEKAYNEEQDEEIKANIKRTLDNFRECAKPPILFLDEVNRTEASVRQVLTNILSSKTFMGHKMSMCRIISAANFAIGSSEELQDAFQTNNTTDSAFNDRFEAIPITPDDVLPSWLSWAESTKNGRQNIHPIILKFLASNKNLYYDFSEVESAYLENYDQDDLSTSPYPNYRTWDLLSQYLYECEPRDKTIQFSTVYGFVGKKAADKIKPYLEREFKVIVEEKENWNAIIEDALINRTPTLLVSPSGIGKSSNINRISKKLGHIMIEVNLAELDRSDVMGAPAKVSTISHIAGQFGNTQALANKLKEIAGGFTLPEYVTVKAPRLDVAQKFQEAISVGRKVTLLFEECNRVTNPMIMSAIFEAISDHRIFGIDFDPKQVSIIAACNMGEGFQDVQSLDSAFAARFNIHRKRNYSEEDVESIRLHVRENYSDILDGYISSLSDQELIDMVSSVENREIQQSVSSTRALYDLDLFLKDDTTTSVVKGAMIYKDSTSRRSLGRVDSATSFKDGAISKQMQLIDKSLANWCALDSGITINIGDEVATPRELKQMYEECKTHLQQGENDYFDVFVTLIKAIADVDLSASNTRRQAIAYIIGESRAKEFCAYYNKVSGTSIVKLKISDLKDCSLFKDYIDQETTLGGRVQPEHIRALLMRILRDIYQEFQLSLPVDNYRHYIEGCLDYINTSDGRLIFLKEAIKDANIDAIICKAENQEVNYVSSLLQKTGTPVDIDKLDKLSKGLVSVGTTYKTRFI